jgi:hypothetical protein
MVCCSLSGARNKDCFLDEGGKERKARKSGLRDGGANYKDFFPFIALLTWPGLSISVSGLEGMFWTAGSVDRGDMRG